MNRPDQARMNPVPDTIDGARVICSSPIDEHHRFTARTRQIVDGELMGAMSGLAIGQYAGDGDFHLFGCDADWRSITDTCHPTGTRRSGRPSLSMRASAPHGRTPPDRPVRSGGESTGTRMRWMEQNGS